MKTRTLVINAIIAALYVAVTMVVAPIAYGAVQFRISEVFNHLAVFNKKYIVGIVVGVFIVNLFSPFGWYDLVFGTAHSLISLLAMLFLTRYAANVWVKMGINTLMFAFFSFIVAWELYLLGLPFWFSYLTVAFGELVVMAIGAPVMKYLGDKLQLSTHV